MIYVASLLAVVCFVIAFRWLRLVPVVLLAMQVAGEAKGIMLDTTLDDDEKGTSIRWASIKLMGYSFSILMRGVVAVGLSALPVVAFHFLKLASHTDITDFLLSGPGILIASLVMTVGSSLLRTKP